MARDGSLSPRKEQFHITFILFILMFFNSSILDKITNISQKLRENNLTITLAESCSGGLISAAFTEIPGASDIFDCSFVTYSNQSKKNILSVNTDILERFGAVSSQTAHAMAIGAQKISNSNIALSVTGIAGPNSDSTQKKVGLVYIGLATKRHNLIRKFNFTGNRSEIRKQTLLAALEMIERYLIPISIFN